MDKVDLDFSKCETVEDVEEIIRDSALKEVSERVSTIGKLVALSQVKSSLQKKCKK